MARPADQILTPTAFQSRFKYRMKALTVAALLGLSLAGCSASQGNGPAPIDAASLSDHVHELASDKYEGRGTGFPGERRAAEYIAAQFEQAGLDPYQPGTQGPDAYLQPFEFDSIGGDEPWLKQTSQNVIGILPGTDLADEYIVIGGHYDGQGMLGQASLGRNMPEDSANDDAIWNSAVDNAVSISALIEIAKYLASDEQGLRRTIVFVAFGAEESSLDGSTFLANNPFPGRDKTRAVVNLEKLVGDPDASFLYVSYSSAPVFAEVAETVIARTGTAMEAFYPGVIANTDHYPFILSGVPGITIGTGSANNVHLPSDHSDGLDYDLLAKRTRFVRQYLGELANSEGDFTFSANLSGRLGALGGPATETEMDSRGAKGTGLKIANVVLGSVADRVGIRRGDLVVAVNGQPIEPKSYYQGLEDMIGEDRICSRNSLLIKRDVETLQIVVDDACPKEVETVIN